MKLKLFDLLEIYPDAPGCTTLPADEWGQGVHALRLPSTCAGSLGPGRMTFTTRVAVDYAFGKDRPEQGTNEDPMHIIAQMRATPLGWDTGYYRGHGGILGPVFGGTPRARLETWGPHYNPKGAGGNFIPPHSESGWVRGATLYDWRITSLCTEESFKYFGYSIGEPNQVPLLQTGDVADDNEAVDMTSSAFFLGVHFKVKPGQPAGIVRLTNGWITHTPDCTPMPDLRQFTGAR